MFGKRSRPPTTTTRTSTPGSSAPSPASARWWVKSTQRRTMPSGRSASPGASGTRSSPGTPSASRRSPSRSSDPERARARLVECASLQRALGDRYVDDVNFVVTAVVGAFVEDAEITCRAAAAVLDRGVTTNPLVLAPMLEAVASCLADRAPEDAAIVQGAVDALVPGMRDWGMYGAIREKATTKIAKSMTPEMIDRLHAQGAAMTLDDARSFVAKLIERESNGH